MSGTFSQIYIQIVFTVKGRENLIGDRWKTDLHKYITGIIKGKGQKPIIVNGMPDHIHAFVGMRPAMSISDLVRDIKNNSSNFINDRKFVKRRVAWQEGYAHFLIHIRILREYTTIFLTRKNITDQKRLKKSILDF